MGDSDLRRRARTASTDPAERLRLARALERAGQTRAAMATLVGGCHAPEVRRAAARFPCDRDPLRQAPRVRWEQVLDGRDQLRLRAVTPLGVFLSSGSRTLVLDADTRVPRRTLPKGEVLLAGEVALIDPRGKLAAFDAWTGEALYRLDVKDRNRSVGMRLRGDRLVLGRFDEVLCYRFEDVRRPPALEWEREVPSPMVIMLAHLTGELVLVHRLERRTPPIQLVALSAADGRERFRRPDLACGLADDALVVTHDRAAGDAVGLDVDGREVWRARDWSSPFAMTSTNVVCTTRDRLLTLDRRTGHATALAALPFQGARWPHCALAEDVVVVACGAGIAAIDLTGRTLWTWRTPDGREVRSALTLPGRVYAELDGRRVVCLEGDG